MKAESQNLILHLRRKLLTGLIVLLAALLAVFEFSHRYNYGPQKVIWLVLSYSWKFAKALTGKPQFRLPPFILRIR